MTATERPSELLGCPFCKSATVRVATIRDGIRAMCSDCGAAGPPVFYGPEGVEVTRASAICSWNIAVRVLGPAPTNPAEIGSKSVVEPNDGKAIASALNKWMAMGGGARCVDPHTLGNVVRNKELLFNRIEAAFVAGWEACEQRARELAQEEG